MTTDEVPTKDAPASSAVPKSAPAASPTKQTVREIVAELKERAGPSELWRPVRLRRVSDKKWPQRLAVRECIVEETGQRFDGVLLPRVPNLKAISKVQAATGLGVTTTGGITTQKLKEMYPGYAMHRPIPSRNIREMTDPYNAFTRRTFTDCARTDPTLSASLYKRNRAFLRGGILIDLQMRSKRSPYDGHLLSPIEEEALLNQYRIQFGLALKQLADWSNGPEIRMLERLRTIHYASIVQGRGLCKFFPPLEYLEPGVLPLTMKIISAEEVGNVIIDRMTEKIVAVRIYSIDEENFTCLPDEMVYLYLNDSALTRYERFYGRSELEPVVQLSRINKYILNEGYAKAFEAAYISKVLTALRVDGSPQEKIDRLEEYANMLSQQDVIAVEAGENVQMQGVPVEVRHEMIENIRRDIGDVIRAAGGATKTQIGITEEITRDNATIQEIENQRNVKRPDEQVFLEAFERQLLTPLLSHLVGVPPDALPVEVKIWPLPDPEEDALLGALENTRNSNPEGRQDNLSDKKEGEIDGGSYKQDDHKSSFGAAGAVGAAGAPKQTAATVQPPPPPHQLDPPSLNADLYRTVEINSPSREGFAWTPGSNRLHSAATMHADLCAANNLDATRPVYLVAATAHEGRLDGTRMHQAYQQASGATATPTVAYWRDPDTAAEYVDLSQPIQALTDAHAIDLARHRGQRSILKLHPEGQVEFL